MIEKHFDIQFIANLSLREKQIQQNYRPVIAVHKWFARRPGTLFRGLLLSEFSDKPLREVFYKSNSFPELHVADPFMGGGTPILEANRIGCKVTGFDINPMSYWIVKQEIEHLDLRAYAKTAELLRTTLEKEIGNLYRTRCVSCGSEDAFVKYFLWVKVKKCRKCEEDIDLFPGYLIAADSRHPQNVFVCSDCGELTETDSRNNPGQCPHCFVNLILNGPAKRSHCRCPACGTENLFPDAELGPPRHRLFAWNTTAQRANLAMLEGSLRSLIPRTLKGLPRREEGGQKYVRSMFQMSRYQAGMKPIACTAGDTDDTWKCSISDSLSAWNSLRGLSLKRKMNECAMHLPPTCLTYFVIRICYAAMTRGH